ncbi:hypothetical protein F5146DRAFT_1006352 [Armillaria mellea]|nr:hypothetical protein F5146DRAFT_1006352 [Armillaria mellea]
MPRFLCLLLLHFRGQRIPRWRKEVRANAMHGGTDDLNLEQLVLGPARGMRLENAWVEDFWVRCSCGGSADVEEEGGTKIGSPTADNNNGGRALLRHRSTIRWRTERAKNYRYTTT